MTVVEPPDVASWIESISTLVATLLAVGSAGVAVWARRAARAASRASEDSAARALATQKELADALRSIEEMQRSDRRVQWKIVRSRHGYELQNVGKVDADNVKLEKIGNQDPILYWPEEPVTIRRGSEGRYFGVDFQRASTLRVRVTCAQDPEGEERTIDWR